MEQTQRVGQPSIVRRLRRVGLGDEGVRIFVDTGRSINLDCSKYAIVEGPNFALDLSTRPDDTATAGELLSVEGVIVEGAGLEEEWLAAQGIETPVWQLQLQAPGPQALAEQLLDDATFGYSERVASALNAGAPADYCRSRPLRIAAANGHLETVRLLVNHGASIEALQYEALRMAAKGGYDDVVDLLLSSSETDPSAKNEALNLASEGIVNRPGLLGAARPTPTAGHINVVRVLLARGAELGSSASRVLLLADSHGDAELVSLIRTLSAGPAEPSL